MIEKLFFRQLKWKLDYFEILLLKDRNEIKFRITHTKNIKINY